MHPSSALTVDLLSADKAVVRQLIFIKLPGRADSYKVLSRQLTTSATAKHFKCWPVDGVSLGTDPDAWINTYTKMHADRGFTLSAEFVVDVTESEIEELKADTTPRALMIRIDRSRDSVGAGMFAPMSKHVHTSSENTVGDVRDLVQTWRSTDAPDLAPAGRARAPKPATPAAPAPTASEAPAPATDTDPSARVRIGDKIVISSTGTTYITRKLEGDLSDVQALRDSRDANLSALLYSLPGTGKTMAVLAAFDDSLLTVQCTSDTEASDFVGTFVPTAVAGEFAWVDGPLVTAMEEGRPLLVDEIALADTRTLAVLYSAMDGRRELVVTANPRRGTIKAKPGFYVIGACNPNAPGARMSEALLSRFPIQVEYTTDYKAMETLGVSHTLVAIARNLEAKRISQEIATSPQARELIGFKRTSDVFGEDVALRNLIAGTPEADRAVVADVIARGFGHAVRPLSTS